MKHLIDIGAVLAHARTLPDVTPLEAQLVLGTLLSHERSWIIAHPETPLTEEQAQHAAAMLDRLAQGAQHQGVLAVLPRLELADWSEVVARPQLLAIALDQVQDPQNFGAVIRSAVATADAAVVWGEHASAPLGTATFRASAGAIEHATLCRVPALKDALALAREHGARVVGLAARAERLLSEVDLTGPTVIVLGSEGSGLQPAVRRACSELAAIVRPRILDSLNASVAAAIALYEASKQRESRALGSKELE